MISYYVPIIHIIIFSLNFKNLKAGKQPKEFCDEISSKFSQAFQHFEVTPNEFIRTTHSRHAEVVDLVWRRIAENGHIYRDSYESWYLSIFFKAIMANGLILWKRM